MSYRDAMNAWWEAVIMLLDKMIESYFFALGAILACYSLKVPEWFI